MIAPGSPPRLQRLDTVADFFGTDKVEFDVVSGRTLNGEQLPARHFERCSDALEEIIDARGAASTAARPTSRAP